MAQKSNLNKFEAMGESDYSFSSEDEVFDDDESENYVITASDKKDAEMDNREDFNEHELEKNSNVRRNKVSPL